jgi:hypothetical protein
MDQVRTIKWGTPGCLPPIASYLRPTLSPQALTPNYLCCHAIKWLHLPANGEMVSGESPGLKTRSPLVHPPYPIFVKAFMTTENPSLPTSTSRMTPSSGIVSTTYQEPFMITTTTPLHPPQPMWLTALSKIPSTVESEIWES